MLQKCSVMLLGSECKSRKTEGNGILKGVVGVWNCDFGIYLMGYDEAYSKMVSDALRRLDR